MAELNFYQLSMTGAQVKTVLEGAVVANGKQDLTEDEKAQARMNIGATAAGNGIRILARFSTLSDLKSTITNPSAGDAYSVGTAAPYNLYIYDGYYKSWKDYGPIRATDISARFSQDLDVPVSAWAKDEDVFVDYTWKAGIPITGITSNAIPIVVFSPADALSGKFCPIAYTFDGYVEIFAKEKPTSSIIIQSITFLIEGSA